MKFKRVRTDIGIISRDELLERLRHVEEALRSQPVEMETQSSPDAVRSAAQKGLAYLPYLTIEDIIQLRAEGIHDFETLESRVTDVPEAVWPHVLWLVRARVLRVPNRKAHGRRAHGNGDGSRPCMALTRSGGRCKNAPREGSKYCSSHKGYQPTEIERKARQQGLLP